MIADYHFLRPWWLASIPVLLLLFIWLWRQTPSLQSWYAIGDKSLLAPLMQHKRMTKRSWALLLLFSAAMFLIISLAGPAWSKLPVPLYQKKQARVLVLDLSDNMLVNDVTPDRLTRAKFTLHDVFNRGELGQMGLVVFTSEPFVVAPLTDDAKTIDALLSTLAPTIMPVDGYQLDTAINQAAQLITQAGFTTGQVLILTATPPNKAAISAAEKYARQGITTSVMPIIADQTLTPLFQPLATAGNGMLVPFLDNNNALEQWLTSTDAATLTRSKQNDIPLWRDEGRWFLLPALLCLLPVFRRGWLQRISA